MEGTREEHSGVSSVLFACEFGRPQQHTFRCVRLITLSLFVIVLLIAAHA
jgi:hypothetical protein